MDQSLRDVAGHHYEYDLALFRAASAADIPTVIGAHVSVQRLDLLGDNVRPWFEKAWYEPVSGPVGSPPRPVLGWIPPPIRTPLVRVARAVVGPRRVVPPPPEPESAFGAEVLALIRAEGLGAGDHVLVHTFSLPELDSLIGIAGCNDGLPLVHVLLRRDAEEPSVASGSRGGIRGSFARLAASPGAAAAVRLYADTEELARQYGALVPGVEVGVLPIPHCLAADDGAEPVALQPPLRIVYLGDARGEKGFHLLADLVDAVAARLFPEGRARFLLQSNVSVAGDSAALAKARRRLAAYPGSQVELIPDQLSLSEFHGLIRSADIVLLPYDRHAYARRSSGILVQALAAGRVVVVPAGTWMARQVHPQASVQFGEDTDLADAVVAAVARWPDLAGTARAQAAAWRARHDGKRYIDDIMRVQR